MAEKKMQTWTKNEGFGECVDVDFDAEFECGADFDLGNDTMILCTFPESNGGPRVVVVVRPDVEGPECEVLVPTRIEALLLMQEFLPLLWEVTRADNEHEEELAKLQTHYNRWKRLP